MEQRADQFKSVLLNSGYVFVKSEKGHSFDNQYALYRKDCLLCMVTTDRGSSSMEWSIGKLCDRQGISQSLDLWRIAHELDGDGQENPLNSIDPIEYVKENLKQIEQYITTLDWKQN